MRSSLTVGLIALALLSGCASASPEPSPTPTPTSNERTEVVTPDELLVDVEVSPACLESIRSAQSGPTAQDEVETMFRSVLGACTTPAEFVSALRLVFKEIPPHNPYAEDVFVALIVTCLNANDMGIESTVCDEAEAKGWLDDLPPGTSESGHPKPGTD